MRRRRTCSICRQPGHWATRCPNRSGASIPAPKPVNASPIIETRIFETLDALLDAARSPVLPEHRSEHLQHSTQRNEFTGFTSNAEAIAMLAGQGCPELAARVRELAVEMLPQVRVTPSLGEAYDVAGSQVDVARFLEGDPECMVDYVSPLGNAKTLDVYLNATVSASVPSSLIEARGAAVCAMIDALETSGTRVRLTWVIALDALEACERGNRLILQARVKDYHAALDTDLVAFVFAHPAMLRQIGITLIEQAPNITVSTQRRCRTPSDISVPDAVYIPSIIPDQLRRWRNPLETVQRLFNGGSL